MTSSKLPGDIMLDILSRLPVKSLARFKCVQKSWRSLFTSPEFITKHRRQAISRTENPSLLIKRMQQETSINMVTLHPRGAIHDFVNITLPLFSENEPHLEVLPVCANGILCLYDHGEAIVLWNPALREFKVIPIHPVSVPSHLDATTKGVGFGYDAGTDDYKVVRITDFWDEDGEPPPCLVEVYNLRTDSWRKVETGMNDYIRYSKCTEMFLNGTYHWWALDGDYDEEEREVILGFDITKEVFRKIHLPDPFCNTNWTTWKCFAVLNDCIALILYPINDTEKYFDIWVMKEYGVKESWTKEFAIGPLAGIDRPLGFWNNEKLLLATTSGEINIYDFDTQEIETLNINGVSDSLRVLNYTESLVSIQLCN